MAETEAEGDDAPPKAVLNSDESSDEPDPTTGVARVPGAHASTMTMAERAQARRDRRRARAAAPRAAVKTMKVPVDFVPRVATMSMRRHHMYVPVPRPDYGPNWPHAESPRALTLKDAAMAKTTKDNRIVHPHPFFCGGTHIQAWAPAALGSFWGGESSGIKGQETQSDRERERAVRGAWSALTTGVGPVDIVVEHCSDCANHGGSVSHHQEKYEGYFNTLRLLVESELAPKYPVTIRRSEGPPRLGAFEVMLEFDKWGGSPGYLTQRRSARGQEAEEEERTHVTVSSKLNVRVFPNMKQVIRVLEQILEVREANQRDAQAEADARSFVQASGLLGAVEDPALSPPASPGPRSQTPRSPSPTSLNRPAIEVRQTNTTKRRNSAPKAYSKTVDKNEWKKLTGFFTPGVSPPQSHSATAPVTAPATAPVSPRSSS
mmetsp:Transcript_23107/g.54042  ORF Transcript_23107/g.54042 Transcript_23107/m.54042 type:complete len:433 (-) Transcript_23107:34-1332(-)